MKQTYLSDRYRAAARQKTTERNYWLERLEQLPAATRFPFDHVTGSEDMDFGTVTVSFTQPQTERLLALSKQSDRMLHMILCAGVFCLLEVLTGERDLMTMVPVYRQESGDDFINTVLPVRVRLPERISFKELLLDIRGLLMEGTKHQNFPVHILFEEMNRSLFDAGSRPADVAVLLDTVHDPGYLRHVNPNMVITFRRQQETMTAIFSFNRGCYEEATVRRWGNLLLAMTGQLIQDVDMDLGQVELVSPEEKETILGRFNRGDEPYPDDLMIHQLVEAQAARSPETVALVHEGRRMTYNEWNRRANGLAAELHRRGVTAGSLVAVMYARGIDMAVAILSVLKAGGAYLPVDPELPEQRIRDLLADTGISLVLTQQAVLDAVPLLALKGIQGNHPAVHLTATRPQIEHFDLVPPPDRSLVDYEAYSRFIGAAPARNVMSLQATRGCPYNCSYCHKIWPKTHIHRSAEHLFAEVKQLYDCGVHRFAILDDIFNLKIDNSRRFFQMIIDHGLDLQLFFPTGMRGDILTPDYIDLMVEAGLVNLPLALETASPRLQNLIRKDLKLERFRENVEYFTSRHPHVVLDLFTMLGFPTETEDEASMTLDFIKSIRWLHFPYVFVLHIYPNTDMEKLAVDCGVSPEAIQRSYRLDGHELPETLPFSKQFAGNYQTSFLNDYFLDKERLLHVLPHQMKVFTQEEILRKYRTYLSAPIGSFEDLLRELNIEPRELPPIEDENNKSLTVPDLNRKLKQHAPAPQVREDALNVLLLDLSQLFSGDADAYNELAEPPLGLMYLLTYAQQQLPGRVNGKIAKSLFDFDNYEELKELIDTFKPDVIGVRTLTYYEQFFHKTIAVIRQWGYQGAIVSGGPHATSCYSTILQDSNIDVVVLGEGELTFTHLLETMLENGNKLPPRRDLKAVEGIAFMDPQANDDGALARHVLLTDIPGFAPEEEANPQPVNTPDHLAYVIYTSGSTGKPKGVEVEHRGVVNMLDARKREYQLDSGVVSLQLLPFSFDGFITSFFTPLISGGTVILPTKNDLLDTARLARLIHQHGVSHFISVPKLYELLIEHITPQQAASLQVVTLAGDRVDPAAIDLTRQKNGQLEIANEYGVTEASVFSTIYRHQELDPHIKIGFPIRNARVYIVDRRMRLLPPGMAGEMCLAGVGVARGYLGDPEKTAARFAPDPYHPGQRLYKTGDMGRYTEDGAIEFLGRRDQQIKVRGFRVETGEIERRLQDHPLVDGTIVTTVEIDGQRKLAAYYVEKENEGPEPELWPSVAEFFVYDDLLYYAMTNDTRRNDSYRAAMARFVKDKVVVDVGTGKDAILSRMCVEEGARKVYALDILEESARKARQTVARLGLQDKITVIHGDACALELPEPADVCVSEIVGAIGGSEGAAAILNKARRLLKEDGVLIPHLSVTKIAAVMLPEAIYNDPGFSPVGADYVEKIFSSLDSRFDLRVCVKNFPQSHIISNIADFEYLDFSKPMPESEILPSTLTIRRDARLDGFLLWLTLDCGAGETIDVLQHEHCWIPVFVPVFYPGIDVRAGDLLNVDSSRSLCENGVNPDYGISGVLSREDRDDMPFDYPMPHFETAFRHNSFYRRVLAGDAVKITGNRSGGLLNGALLRQFLAETLPVYMIPSYFIRLDEWPLTSSGKVDRRRLPLPDAASGGALERDLDSLERNLLDIWAGVLGVESEVIGIGDNFFELGGNSLEGIKLIANVRQDLAVDIPVNLFFQEPTVETMAAMIRSRSTSEDGIPAAERRDYYPLTPAQLGIWMAHQLDPTGIAYNMPMRFRLPDGADLERLEQTFRQLLHRHDALRTSFHLLGDEPVQRVWEPQEVTFRIQRLEVMGDNGVQQAFIQPFDLSRPPLFRVAVHQPGDGSATLLIDTHHIVSDGVSHGVLVADFHALSLGAPLAPLELQYKDYCLWQRSPRRRDELQRQEDYWLDHLQPEPEPLDLPSDFPLESAGAFDGAAHTFVIDADQADALRRIAKEKKATLYMVLLALFNLFLSKLGGSRDIVGGILSAGRNIGAVDAMVGLFVATLPIRLRPAPDITFQQFLEQTRDTVSAAFAHQDIPLETLLGKHPHLRDMFRLRTGFDFQYNDRPAETSDAAGNGSDYVPFDMTNTKAHLGLLGHESGDGIFMAFNYSTALFTAETITRFAAYFRHIAVQVARDPGQPLETVELMDRQEQERMLNALGHDSADEGTGGDETPAAIEAEFDF